MSPSPKYTIVVFLLLHSAKVPGNSCSAAPKYRKIVVLSGKGQENRAPQRQSAGKSYSAAPIHAALWCMAGLIARKCISFIKKPEQIPKKQTL